MVAHQRRFRAHYSLETLPISAYTHTHTKRQNSFWGFVEFFYFFLHWTVEGKSRKWLLGTCHRPIAAYIHSKNNNNTAKNDFFFDQLEKVRKEFKKNTHIHTQNPFEVGKWKHTILWKYGKIIINKKNKKRRQIYFQNCSKLSYISSMCCCRSAAVYPSPCKI